MLNTSETNVPTKTSNDKKLEDYTEDDIKEMFIDMFFWVAVNRPSWLQEAIDRRRKQLGKTKTQT